MAMDATMEEKINRWKEEIGIEKEGLKVSREKLAEIRKNVEAWKDMDDEKMVMDATIFELQDESDRLIEKLEIKLDSLKVSVEELAELGKEVEACKEMEIGDGDEE